MARYIALHACRGDAALATLRRVATYGFSCILDERDSTAAFAYTIGLAHSTVRAAPELVVVAGRRSEHGAMLEGVRPHVLSALLIALANVGAEALLSRCAAAPTPPGRGGARELRVPCAAVLSCTMSSVLGCGARVLPPCAAQMSWLFAMPCLVWTVTQLGEGAWMDVATHDTLGGNGERISTFYNDVAAPPHARASMPTLLCCVADSLAADAARGRELAAWLRRLHREGDGVAGATAPMRQWPATHCAFTACPCRSAGAAVALKRCSRCHAVYYCSAEAQHADWARHKEECSRRHDDRGRA
jgi:hypothetical protein